MSDVAETGARRRQLRNAVLVAVLVPMFLAACEPAPPPPPPPPPPAPMAAPAPPPPMPHVRG